LNPGCGIKEKLGHRLNPGVLRGKQDLPDFFPHLCSSGFTSEQERSISSFKVGGQVADLGSFAAPFDSLEGYEKAQFSPAFK
jgi:hypothetical protein